MAKVRDLAHELAQKIHEREDSGTTTKATLQTDDRVLARITDGIYRQPASALRELIANAYDADAKSVYIETDVPRFNQLTVKDDGLGLSTEALANLIHHIGGSPKRTPIGVDLGIARPTDPSTKRYSRLPAFALKGHGSVCATAYLSALVAVSSLLASKQWHTSVTSQAESI